MKTSGALLSGLGPETFEQVADEVLARYDSRFSMPAATRTGWRNRRTRRSSI
jgi:hypothetical protein